MFRLCFSLDTSLEEPALSHAKGLHGWSGHCALPCEEGRDGSVAQDRHEHWRQMLWCLPRKGGPGSV